MTIFSVPVMKFLIFQDTVEQEEVIEDDFDIIHDGVLGSDTLSKYRYRILAFRLFIVILI
jgi:hypothetical protein